MDTENLTIYRGRQRQVVKQVRELLPDGKTSILALALDLEAVDLRNLARFMITSQKKKPAWKPQFEQYQVRNGFNGSGPSVHIVSQEEVIRVGYFTSNSKQLDHVEELTMYITDDGDRRRHLANILLARQNFFHFRTGHLYRDLFKLLSLFRLFEVKINIERESILGQGSLILCLWSFGLFNSAELHRRKNTFCHSK